MVRLKVVNYAVGLIGYYVLISNSLVQPVLCIKLCFFKHANIIIPRNKGHATDNREDVVFSANIINKRLL